MPLPLLTPSVQASGKDSKPPVDVANVSLSSSSIPPKESWDSPQEVVEHSKVSDLDDSDAGATTSQPAGSTQQRLPRSKQLKTCGECRRQHLRCDFSQRVEAERAVDRSRPVRCSRCEHRGINCVQVGLMNTRYFPRPTRTGRRIELGRQLHGSTVYSDGPGSEANIGQAESAGELIRLELSWPRIYLRLLNCYFCCSHSSNPTVDPTTFIRSFNMSLGDVHLMARFLNGEEGDEETREFFAGSHRAKYAKGTGKFFAEPETLEVLLVLMCAYAVHHINLPFESMDPAVFQEIGGKSLVHAVQEDLDLGFRRASSSTATEAGRRRVKRRQGVACDTCRLRRVRCDLMEQPPGSKACSRCRVKRIVCTDRYIQWKRQRDTFKRPMSTRALAKEVQLLPEREQMFVFEPLPHNFQTLTQHELLEYGVTREGACNILLRRVLKLVHKYDLRHRCTIQTVKVMNLLADHLYYTRSSMSFEAQRVSALHLEQLFPNGLRLCIDDICPEKWPLFHRALRASRAMHVAWVTDAISGMSYLRKPLMPSDYVCITERTPEGEHPVSLARMERVADEVAGDGCIGPYALLLTLIGRVAHVLYASVYERLSSESGALTRARIDMLNHACEEFWENLYTLERMHMVLVRKLRDYDLLELLRPIWPVNWGVSIYNMFFLLSQSLSRRLRDWYNASRLGLGYGESDVSKDETGLHMLENIRQLLQRSQSHTLMICRVNAQLMRNLLDSGTLLRSSPLWRQLFRMAQFIARSQPVDEAAKLQSELEEPPNDGAPLHKLLNPTSGHPPPSPPPSWAAPSFAPLSPDAPKAAANYDALLKLPRSRDLEPFTHAAKNAEIDWFIRALGQLGFAYAGLETEIRRIVDIMHASEN